MSIDWIKDELEYMSFSDERLNKRLLKIVSKLSESPESKLSEAFGDKEELKRFYEFMSNSSVSYKNIIEGSSSKVIDRINLENRVLIASDTTDIDYHNLKSVDDLGNVNQHAKGMVVHSSFAINLSGVPLGVVNQTILSRTNSVKKESKNRHLKKIKEKESYKWLAHYLYCQEKIDKPFIYIGDRESDIINLFSLPRLKNQDLLIRSMHNRKLENSDLKLYDFLKSKPILGSIKIKLSSRKNDLPKDTKVSIRYSEVTLKVPSNNPDKKDLSASKMNAIYIEEINSDVSSKDRIKWFLLTTLPINSLEDAITYLYYYTLRWLIERFHYVLKSGCYIEKLQLKKEVRLSKTLAVYNIIAWRLLWLTYESRKDESQECSVFFSDFEWKYLNLTVAKKENILDVPTLKEATTMMAILGGYLNRKSDPPPGVKVIWKGYRRLQERIIGFKQALDFIKEPNALY